MIIRTWIGGEISFCFHYLDFCLISLLLFVVQSCPTLSSPIGYSTLGLLVPHHLPKFAQVHVRCIGDAIQPSHSLTPSSLSAFNLSQQQGLFQWVGSLHQMTQILELQFFQRVSRVDYPWDWLVWSPCYPRDFQESSPAPQFEGINSLAFLAGKVWQTSTVYWEEETLLCQQRSIESRLQSSQGSPMVARPGP